MLHAAEHVDLALLTQRQHPWTQNRGVRWKAETIIYRIAWAEF